MATSTIRVAIAQINPVVCDLHGNADKIIEYCRRAEQRQADIIVFPECALSGYPLDDIVVNPGIYQGLEEQLERIASVCQKLYVMVGHPESCGGSFHNAASILHKGRVIHCYRKQRLPNHGMFDEQRQFSAGMDLCLFTVNGITIAPAICEDIWSDHGHISPQVQIMKEAGAMLLLTAHGSPYHTKRHRQRIDNLQQLSSGTGLPVVCSHLVGGQDDFVFDGASIAMNGDGKIALQAPAFCEGLYLLQAECAGGMVSLHSDCHNELPNETESLYQALVLATNDFVLKSGHQRVLLGLSGGIDSALIACIAVDALGPEAVTALLMPSPHTLDMSTEDAESLARHLGIEYKLLPIDTVHKDFIGLLQADWPSASIDTADENLQARCRGMLLMAVANRTGALVLGTGNKSEAAVGYSTLYGDTAAAFNPIGDVYKSGVYSLANWRQQNVGPTIPERIIGREPSAELKPGQLDKHSLPDYEVLDAIVKLYAEQDKTAEQIMAEGFAAETVHKVLQQIEINEYKRRQSPPAPKVSQRSLQRERRYPICSKWQRPATQKKQCP
ncbi:MAG: NAD+ synthase [Candidatus Porifericomitaceae bacterium WSBS_2022_MAG_OTU9]